MKKIGFLNFGHWTSAPTSKVRTASDSLLQSIELAVAAEELGADGAYFWNRGDSEDKIGFIDSTTRAVFGRTHADEPDKLVEQLAGDEAVAAADTLLLTVPNQLGVDYNAHLIGTVLRDVAPGLGWR